MLLKVFSKKLTNRLKIEAIRFIEYLRLIVSLFHNGFLFINYIKKRKEKEKSYYKKFNFLHLYIFEYN